MDTSFLYKIYNKTSQLSADWDFIADENIFLKKTYLNVLETSSPRNMKCHFIGIFKNNELVGIALTQMISLSDVKSFGASKSCIQAKIRDFVFKRFASNVLFVGNNMLTGQNAFRFTESITFIEFITAVNKAVAAIEQNFKINGTTIHILNYKDFDQTETKAFQIQAFRDFYNFEIQPNMIFDVMNQWLSADDYVAALSKKYRDQYKRSHKKAFEVSAKELSLQEIVIHRNKIYELYLNVTKNAPFNTFYLSENHFENMKEHLGFNFILSGYFIGNEMVGFSTLIKNGSTLETYFLGYDDGVQREKMLYLNMLYDMISYGIHNKFKNIIFARTALEIKSSVGAKPQRMYGFMKHQNKIVNYFLPKLFKYFEPQVTWQERNPFK